ncbi:hypothetical protein LCGC14_1483520 [marine sediment metagenome]|uniref:Phosphoribosyltransferase domain-containing protein n=1 Tax=marine sediment metagenome TaxID=412755 RepID=A0A0F9JUP9_9ZZZZ
MILLNGVKIIPTMFPDKTSQIWKLSDSDTTDKCNEIRWEYEHESELFHICQLADLIQSMGKTCYLKMDYLPYGRQDKEIDNKNSFALYTFAKIINSCHFVLVTFMDGHSKIAEDLIHNAINLFPSKYIQFAINSLDNPVLAYPDTGAFIRYSKVYGKNAILGKKVRDSKTGYISHYEIQGDPENKNILMVDDIIDGGMTFKIMARDLISYGTKSVHLYATHGIFSKGTQTLRDSGIERIFTSKGEIK